MGLRLGFAVEHTAESRAIHTSFAVEHTAGSRAIHTSFAVEHTTDQDMAVYTTKYSQVVTRKWLSC